MHASMLADLASTIALHGPVLLWRPQSIPAAALQQYWIASRSRASAWHQELSVYRQHELAHDSAAMRRWWMENLPLMEEVLITDILTRVYAAVGAAVDEQAAEPEVSPVVHSVYLSHLEARNRVLGIMISRQGASVDGITSLNQLRKTVERWVDVLIGQIASIHPETARYAIALERATSFAEEVSDYARHQRQTAGWLMSAAMRDALHRQATDKSAASPVENGKICDAILMCLRPDMFDSHGTLQSLWIHRLVNGTQEADNILESLLSSAPDQNALLSGYESVRDPSFSKRLR